MGSSKKQQIFSFSYSLAWYFMTDKILWRIAFINILILSCLACFLCFNFLPRLYLLFLSRCPFIFLPLSLFLSFFPLHISLSTSLSPFLYISFHRFLTHFVVYLSFVFHLLHHTQTCTSLQFLFWTNLCLSITHLLYFFQDY